MAVRKQSWVATVLLIGGLLGGMAQAVADEASYHPLADVIALGTEQGKLDGSVRFYLKGQAVPGAVQRLSGDVSNKRTNGVGKTDEFACKWAALSALIAFQSKAKSLGANAVVDIVSFYKKDEYQHASNFECHSGAIMSAVTLKGTYATVR